MRGVRGIGEWDVRGDAGAEALPTPHLIAEHGARHAPIYAAAAAMGEQCDSATLAVALVVSLLRGARM